MVFAQVMAERNLHTFDDQIVFALAILRTNIVPYFSSRQINDLKKCASNHAISLFETISAPKHLKEAKIKTEQQECETVFLLGIDSMKKKRLYVSVSRAKQRLFLVGDGAAFAKNTILSQVPPHLYTTLHYGKASMERDDTVQKL